MEQEVKAQCSLCKNFFKKLKLHIRNAHGPRKYNCDKYDKSFIYKRMLDSHISIAHEKSKPFECSICNANFANEKSLQTHKDHYHASTITKSFKCDIRYFHSGISKLFKCELC